jgi:creatinine amidohydrolase
MTLLPAATSADEKHRAAQVAVLPIGSFEQHGSHLPLITDTVVACAIAERVAATYGLFLLPPVTISCSHEHSAWPGTVSISHTTLTAIITDVQTSLRRSGIERLALVNGHGGNYVLNIVQEANVSGPVMTLFPTREDWDAARTAAELATDAHDDMHAGEIEVSILRHVAPDLIKPGVDASDHPAALDRRLLLVHGMAAYTSTGVIGAASKGTADKGRMVLDSLVAGFKDHLDALTAAG